MLLQNDTRQILVCDVDGWPCHIHPGAWVTIQNDSVLTVKISDEPGADEGNPFAVDRGLLGEIRDTNKK